MRFIFVSIFSFAFVFFGFSQDTIQKDDQEYQLTSPYQTLLTHLKFLQDESYKPEVAAAAFFDGKQENKNRKQLAVQLKQILDGKGMYIDFDIVPSDANYIDSTTNKHRYYINRNIYPELYLEKKGSSWYYSDATVSKISTWHKEVYPYGTDQLLNILPKIGNKKYLGLYIWQAFGVLLLIIISFIILR